MMKMKPTGSMNPAGLRCGAGRTTIAILLSGAAIFATGCATLDQPPGSRRDASSKSNTSTPTEPVSHRDIQRDKEVVLRAHREVWSRGNMDVVKEIYDESYVCHFNGEVGWKGTEGLKKTVTDWRAEYPDWCETVNQIVVEGDLVVTRWTSTGTYSGLKYPDLAGKKVSVSEMAIHRVKDGKIVEQWGLEDSSAYKKQLGRDIY